MAIATAVVGDALMAASVAALDVTAEGGGAAELDSAHDAALSARERLGMSLPIDGTEAAEDLRHFEWRGSHRRCLEIGRRGRRWWRGFRPGQQVEGTGGGAHGAGGQFQVARGCGKAAMTHEQLDRDQAPISPGGDSPA